MLTMTRTELRATLDQAHLAFQEGNYELFRELSNKIPLAPYLAKAIKETFGKKFLIENGFNLTDAEEQYGSDWLNN